jgi:hypothetical protein
MVRPLTWPGKYALLGWHKGKHALGFIQEWAKNRGAKAKDKDSLAPYARPNIADGGAQ